MSELLLSFRFAATYLCPSFFPAMITALGILASIVMPPPGSAWPFAANVLMWTGIVTLFVSLTLMLKKLLGRQPSLNEILSGLVSCGTLDDYRKEQHLRHRGLEEQISKIRHDFDARANSDLNRSEEHYAEIARINEVRARDLQALRDTIARLQERTETHIRKLDQYDSKLDRLIEQMGRMTRGTPQR